MKLRFSLNKENLSFTAILGDVIDEGYDNILPIMNNLRKLDAPKYVSLGNHDYYKNFDKNLYKLYDMPAPYYSKVEQGWRFIFLNTNEISSYATLLQSKEENEYKELVAQNTSTNRKNFTDYNGGISQNQLKWLKKELKKAAHKNEKIIIFSHHPLMPENGFEALNNREILSLILDQRLVKAVISGHHHVGGFEMYKDLPCITLEGMVETSDKTAYGILKLTSDKLIIDGSGRLSNRVITLR